MLMRAALLFITFAPLATLAVVPPLWGDKGQLRDSNNATVRLECVSWSGAEQKDHVVGGLDHNSPDHILGKVKEWGFNCLRLPWSVEMVLKNPKVPTENLKAVNFLQGKHALELMDHIVKVATDKGIMVILDNHNSDANWCCGENDGNGLWHTDRWPESKWHEAWTLMAKRYVSNPMVVGAELRNEIRAAKLKGEVVNPTWGGWHASNNDKSFLAVPKFSKVEEKSDWAAAAERGARTVHSVAPEWLVAVHGLDYAYISAPFAQVRPIDKLSLHQNDAKVSLMQESEEKPRSNFLRMGAHQPALSFTEVSTRRQLDVPKKDKLVYVAHDFDWYHQDLTDYPTFEKYIDLAWGNTANKGIAPVWLSEFGTPHHGQHVSAEGCFGDEFQEKTKSNQKLRGKLQWVVDQEMESLGKKGVDVTSLDQLTGMSKHEIVDKLFAGDTKQVLEAYNSLKASPRKKASFTQTSGSLEVNSEAQWTEYVQDALLNIYNSVKDLVPDNRKPGRGSCWWPYLMRYLKERPYIGYSYWRLDGTESRGDSRVFGAPEGFGLFDKMWDNGHHVLLKELKALHENRT